MLAPDTIHSELNCLGKLNHVNNVRSENSQIKLLDFVFFEWLFDIVDVGNDDVDAW